MRVVLDTDVVLSGFISAAGASRQLLLLAIDGGLSLLLSTALLLEYESVLRRPQHLSRAKASDAEVIEILDALGEICVPVVDDFHWRPTGADADDELVVATAINGQADAVATFNAKHMLPASIKFGFRVQRPGPLLRRIRQ